MWQKQRRKDSSEKSHKVGPWQRFVGRKKVKEKYKFENGTKNHPQLIFRKLLVHLGILFMLFNSNVPRFFTAAKL